MKDLQKSTVGAHRDPTAVGRADLDDARGQRRHRRLVIGEHADLALDGARHHEVGLTFPDDRLGRHDVDGEQLGHQAFSISAARRMASSAPPTM